MKILRNTLIALALSPLLSVGAAVSANAEVCGPGDVGDIDTSCAGLWHERNRVFAEAGYCFKGEHALQVFGPGCFPPYGELSHDNRCYVQAIKRMEQQQGCATE